MWDQVCTRLTFGIHNETVMWTVGTRPSKMSQLAKWEQLQPAIALRFIDELRSSGYLDGILALQGVGVVLPHVDMSQRTEQLRWRIANGHVVAWPGLPAFVVPDESGKPISNDILAPLYWKYAQRLGMDAGTPVASPAATEGHKPAVPGVAAVPLPVLDRSFQMRLAIRVHRILIAPKAIGQLHQRWWSGCGRRPGRLLQATRI